MKVRATRRLMAAVLAASLVGGVWAPPSSASTGVQANASATYKDGFRSFTVTGSWANPGDPTQDGSQARPFTPGSRLQLRIEVQGWELVSPSFIPGGTPSLGGAAWGMSTGASSGWYLQSKWTQASGQGMAHISIRPTSVAGGLATWSLSNARFQYINGTFNVPLSGSFYIAASQDPDLKDVVVAAEAREAELTPSCKKAVPSATHQLEVELMAANGSSEDLHNVVVEWAGTAIASPPGMSATGALLVEQAVVFGHLPQGATKQGGHPALTYCLAVPAGSLAAGQINLAGAGVDGYALIGGRQHDRNRLRLGDVSATFHISVPEPPESESIADPLTDSAEETGETSGETDQDGAGEEGESAALLAAREQVSQARASVAEATEKTERKKARANKLVERYRKAQKAYDSAEEKRDAVAASHQKAVESSTRLAQKAVDGEAAAQARADKAAAKAAHKAERLAQREADLKEAEAARDAAKLRADRALAKAKAALAELAELEEALRAATEALEALEND